MGERQYWLGFSVFPGVGPRKFQALLEHFGTAKNAWSASKEDLISSGLGKILTNKFDQFRNEFSIAEYAKKLVEKDVQFVISSDKGYPKLLKQIKNPPFVLYVRGDINVLGGPAAPSIAVVGTRKITQYGREVTEMFTGELVLAGFTIVSGLAMGVDAVAHKTTIESGGKTIAVLGCGVDCCSPEENLGLYNSILRSGCVISELPLGHTPTKGSFPSRNRIIAGLSLGVVVTEGAADSGALITADYAFKNNRKVFAVPGPITSGLSKGPYKLIEKGAKLVTSADDILEELKAQNANLKTTAQSSKRKEIRGETNDEQKILEILENESLNFDEIVKRAKLSSSAVGSLLSMMEIKGRVRDLGGGIFSLVK